jgi:hypothetical protein
VSNEGKRNKENVKGKREEVKRKKEEVRAVGQ